MELLLLANVFLIGLGIGFFVGVFASLGYMFYKGMKR